MDNLTHSVVGLALGALIEHSLPPEAGPARQRVRRKLLLVACWAASNLPDLDLLLTPLAARPLGYLLHHRGYTHTLLWLIPQACALLALLWLAWPDARRLLRASRPARFGVLLAVGPGLVLHLAMDYLNVYGVHPFAPFDGRWLYGDMVFIVEPVFWVALGVPLATMVTRRASRSLLFALLAAAPLYATLQGYLQWGSLAGLAALGLLLAWGERRPGVSCQAVLAAGLALALGYVAVQGLAVRSARRLVTAQLALRDPAERVLDVALSAFPANPLCWAFASVQDDAAAGSYRLRRGVLSLAPALTHASACPAQLGGAPHPLADPAPVAWLWEERGTLAALRDLRRSNCHVDAWMRFARAPSLAAGAATDIRFGPPGSPNFSTLPYAALARAPCPARVPAWAYPRADLLGLP